MRTWCAGAVLLLTVVCLGGCGERGEERAPAADSPETTLFLAGDGEMWVVDVDEQHAEHLRRPELVPGDPPHRIAVVGDELAMWSYDVYTVPTADPSAQAQELAHDGLIFIPAADPDRIWVGYLDRESPERGIEEVREIDSEGNVVTRGVAPPDGAWPHAEVGGGLLLQGRRPTLWDPDTGETLRTWEWEELVDIGPVSDTLIASSSCKTGAMVLTDVVTGDQRPVVPPDGLALLAWAGTFSPDGSTLAVPLTDGGCAQSDDAELALVDVETGAVELVPGSHVRAGYIFTVWSRDGEEVFMTGGERFGERQIVAYRLSEQRARTLAVDVGDFYDIAAG